MGASPKVYSGLALSEATSKPFIIGGPIEKSLSKGDLSWVAFSMAGANKIFWLAKGQPHCYANVSSLIHSASKLEYCQCLSRQFTPWQSPPVNPPPPPWQCPSTWIYTSLKIAVIKIIHNQAMFWNTYKILKIKLESCNLTECFMPDIAVTKSPRHHFRLKVSQAPSIRSIPYVGAGKFVKATELRVDQLSQIWFLIGHSLETCYW